MNSGEPSQEEIVSGGGTLISLLILYFLFRRSSSSNRSHSSYSSSSSFLPASNSFPYLYPANMGPPRYLCLAFEKSTGTTKKRTLFFLFVLALSLLLSSLSVMHFSKNYYAILDVSRHASSAEIKTAFRKMSVIHHPDKSGESGLFMELKEAYDILSKNNTRLVYDLLGSRAFTLCEIQSSCVTLSDYQTHFYAEAVGFTLILSAVIYFLTMLESLKDLRYNSFMGLACVEVCDYLRVTATKSSIAYFIETFRVLPFEAADIARFTFIYVICLYYLLCHMYSFEGDEVREENTLKDEIRNLRALVEALYIQQLMITSNEDVKHAYAKAIAGGDYMFAMKDPQVVQALHNWREKNSLPMQDALNKGAFVTKPSE